MGPKSSAEPLTVPTHSHSGRSFHRTYKAEVGGSSPSAPTRNWSAGQSLRWFRGAGHRSRMTPVGSRSGVVSTRQSGLKWHRKAIEPRSGHGSSMTPVRPSLAQSRGQDAENARENSPLSFCRAGQRASSANSELRQARHHWSRRRETAKARSPRSASSTVSRFTRSTSKGGRGSGPPRSPTVR